MTWKANHCYKSKLKSSFVVYLFRKPWHLYNTGSWRPPSGGHGCKQVIAIFLGHLSMLAKVLICPHLLLMPIHRSLDLRWYKEGHQHRSLDTVGRVTWSKPTGLKSCMGNKPMSTLEATLASISIFIWLALCGLHVGMHALFFSPQKALWPRWWSAYGKSVQYKRTTRKGTIGSNGEND